MLTIVKLYLIGALATFVAVLIAAPRFDRDSGYRWRHGLAALSAVIWPIMAVGLLQMGLLAAAAAALPRLPAARSHQQRRSSTPVGV